METALTHYLASQTIIARESAIWDGGRIQLELTAYAATALPPDALITSARALLIAGNQVVVLTNSGGDHILPGGRREADETPLEALYREVAEETGLSITNPGLLGVIHYHHTTPEPSGYPYPFPDFLNVIYKVDIEPGQPLTAFDDYEVACRYHPVDEIRRLPLTPCQFALADLALAKT